MKFSGFLKDSPLAFTLRVLALAIILSIVGLNLSLIQAQVRSLKRGYIPNMGFHVESKDYAVIDWVGSDNQLIRLSGGDIVLNPEALLDNEVGRPVTLLIKSENAPAREVTVIPESRRSGYFLTKLGLSQRAIVDVQIIFLWASLIFTGLFSVVAFWRRLDAWLVFLVVMALLLLCVLVNGNLELYFLKLFLPSALIFFLIVFPTGKLAPRWSWLLVLLPLPNNMIPTLFKLGILEINHFINFPNILGEYSTIFFLIVLWGILYEYRNKFTLFQRRWVNWLSLGLILINIPSWSRFLLFLGAPGSVANHSLGQILHIGTFVYYVIIELFSDLGFITILLVLGVVIYRYHTVFKPMERQQMKWLAFGLVWNVGLFALLYMFILYYLSSGQTDKAYSLSYSFDKFFILTAEVTIFCALLSIFRYRLYDVDTFLNRALVYSGLIIVLGVVCLLSTMFVDYAFGKSGEQNDMLTLGISIILMIVTFNPARLRLQNNVNRYFQSEDLDFEGIFYEFTSEMRGVFTSDELSKILATKSVEQFGVTNASVYIKNSKGKLQHIQTEPMEMKRSRPVIDPQALSKLEEGELAVPDVNSMYSLIIPLVLSRGQKRDIIGALVLGRRLDSLEYSTVMMKKLKNLGQEIGKALYAASIQDLRYERLARRLAPKTALHNK